MGRVIPAGIRPPFEILPSGVLAFEVEKFEAGSQNVQGVDVLTYNVELSVVGPAEAAGMSHSENFFIGTKEDPWAQQDETWQKRSGRLKEFVEACQWQFEGADIDQIAVSIVKSQCLGQVTLTREPVIKNNQMNPYANKLRARIRTWYAQGEREVGVDGFVPPELPIPAGGIPAAAMAPTGVPGPHTPPPGPPTPGPVMAPPAPVNYPAPPTAPPVPNGGAGHPMQATPVATPGHVPGPAARPAAPAPAPARRIAGRK